MKPKIIGLTGGIGSGKTTVAQYFSELGVPVYIADDAAKLVMQQPETIAAISKAFIDVVDDNAIDRSKLADIVFNNPEQLEHLNKIVHPRVIEHFNEWMMLQDFPFVIKEAAILFESGSYRDCDAVITITAPFDERIHRVMTRDNTTREKVLQRIGNQWSDEMRISNSDFVIVNTDPASTKEHVLLIFNELMNY